MGYRRRDRLKHQLMAECAYAAMYALRDPQGKTVADIFPQIFEDNDDYDDDNIPEIDLPRTTDVTPDEVPRRDGPGGE